MNKDITVSIKNPCSEKFDGFKATKDGGFCDVCQREVIDFTKMTDSEIIAYFQSNQKKTCGKFSESQLKTYKHLPVSRPKYNLKAIGLGLISFSLVSIFSMNTVKAQQTLPTEITQSSQAENSEKIENDSANEITISGVITSPEGTLPGAVVYIKGTNIGVQTDIEGNFNLHIPEAYLENGVLVFSFIGYDRKEMEIKENMPSVITVKLESTCNLIGEVSIGKPYQSKRTFWQKFKGVFR